MAYWLMKSEPDVFSFQDLQKKGREEWHSVRNFTARNNMMKMKVGDLWEVVVPSDQAYGTEGRGARIPPNQTLIFVISLAKVEYAG